MGNEECGKRGVHGLLLDASEGDSRFGGRQFRGGGRAAYRNFDAQAFQQAARALPGALVAAGERQNATVQAGGGIGAMHLNRQRIQMLRRAAEVDQHPANECIRRRQGGQAICCGENQHRIACLRGLTLGQHPVSGPAEAFDQLQGQRAAAQDDDVHYETSHSDGI